MSGEEIGDVAALRAMLAHAQLQRLQALQHDPGVERAERRAGMLQKRMKLLDDEVLGAEHDAAEAATLAVDMLGRGVEHDVGAHGQRLLQHRRGEDVVDDQPRAGGVAQVGDGLDVDELQRGIGRRLDEDAARAGLQRVAPLIQIGTVDELRRDAIARQQFLDDVAAGPEQRARGDDAIAGAHLAHDRGVHRGHAGGKRARGRCAFELAHALFEHRHRRIAVAAVDVAGIEILESGLRRLGVVIDVARGEIDGLGGLAELAARQAAAHEARLRTPGLLLCLGLRSVCWLSSGISLVSAGHCGPVLSCCYRQFWSPVAGIRVVEHDRFGFRRRVRRRL